MKKKIVLRNQRGSISLFVLLSILFFLVIVTGVATSTKNKETKTNAQIARVKAIYEKDVGNEQQIYNKKVQQQQSNKKKLTVNPNGGTWRDSTEIATENQDEGTELNLGTPTPPSVTFNLDGGALKGEEPEAITFKEWQLKDGDPGELSGNTYTFGNGNATITAIYNNTPVTLPDAEKSGFIFAGWFKDTTRVGGAESNYTPKGAVTLTAHWTEEATTNIELAFIDASGEEKHGTPNPLVLQENQTSGTVTAPTIGAYTTGWEAKYWTAGEYPDSEQAVISGGTLENVSANRTYYAIYEKELTLTYNANGGTNDVPATQTRTITTNSFNLSNTTSAQVTLAAGTGLTKEGYIFAGWKSSTDNEVYEAGENFTLTEDTIMTAQWTEAIYTITYDLDGGNIESGNENPTSYTTETEAFTLNNPTKTGYTFAGWTGTGLNNATNTVTVEQGSTGNRAYTATWTINTSNLTINPDGGTVSVKSPSSSEAEEISTSTPYIQNYNTTLKYETPTKADSTDKTTKYTVTYNTDGGSTAPANQDATITIVTEYEFDGWTKSTGFKGTLNETEKTYTFPADNNNTDTITATYTSSVKSTTVASVTLPEAPTKNGYTFKGWKSSTDGKVYEAGAKYTPTNNTTMTAQWELNAITFENKTITKTFSTSAQTETNGVNEATGGTGTYTYEITGGNTNNYFSLSGRNITIAANTPANVTGYEITIKATDSNSGATKSATYTIKINKIDMTVPTVSIDTDGKITWTQVTGADSYHVKIGDGNWETATSGAKTISTATTGIKTVAVRAVSTSGNYNTPSSEGTASKEVYSLTLNKGTGISAVTGAGNYIEGKEINIDATVSTGYTWSKWNKTSGTAPANANNKSTTITIGANTVLEAQATASALTFTEKTITKTFSTSAQTETNGVNEATGGTGTYTYEITGGNTNNYFSLSGRNITIAANTPANVTGYEITIKATDSNSGATKSATYTIKINKKQSTTNVTIKGINTVGQTLTADKTTDGDGLVSYQWYHTSVSDSNKITNATNATFVPTSDLVGKKIYVDVAVADGTNYLGSNNNDATDATENGTENVKANEYTVEYYQGATKINTSTLIPGATTNNNLAAYNGTNPTGGWEFAGWSANNETTSTTVTYTDEQNITTDIVAGGQTAKLYAIFTREVTVTYTITADKPSTDTDTITQYYNPNGDPTSVSVTLPDVTDGKKENIFDGWNDESDNKVGNAGEVISVTGDMDLTSRWKHIDIDTDTHRITATKYGTDQRELILDNIPDDVIVRVWTPTRYVENKRRHKLCCQRDEPFLVLDSTHNSTENNNNSIGTRPSTYTDVYIDVQDKNGNVIYSERYCNLTSATSGEFVEDNYQGEIYVSAVSLVNNSNQNTVSKKNNSSTTPSPTIASDGKIDFDLGFKAPNSQNAVYSASYAITIVNDTSQDFEFYYPTYSPKARCISTTPNKDWDVTYDISGINGGYKILSGVVKNDITVSFSFTDPNKKQGYIYLVDYNTTVDIIDSIKEDSNTRFKADLPDVEGDLTGTNTRAAYTVNVTNEFDVSKSFILSVLENEKFVLVDENGNENPEYTIAGGTEEQEFTFYLQKADGANYVVSEQRPTIVFKPEDSDSLNIGKVTALVDVNTTVVDTDPPEISDVKLQISDTEGEALVTWEGKDEITGVIEDYFIYLYKQNGQDVTKVGEFSTGNDDTNKTITGLVENQTYYVVVFGRDGSKVVPSEDVINSASTDNKYARKSNNLTPRWNFSVSVSKKSTSGTNYASFPSNYSKNAKRGSSYSIKITKSNRNASWEVTTKVGGNQITPEYSPTLATENNEVTLTVPKASVTGDITIEVAATTSCLVEGTPILQADGTYKNIEDITYTDLLRVYNHVTGEMSNIYPIYIEKESISNSYEKISFSDGTELKVVGEHCLFSVDSNRYVNVVDESECKIGTRVYKINDDKLEEVTITNIEYITEDVKYYHVVSAIQYNVIANGLITSDQFAALSNIYGFKENATYSGMYYIISNINQLPYEDCNFLPHYIYKGANLKNAGSIFGKKLDAKYLSRFLSQSTLDLIQKDGKAQFMMTTSLDDYNSEDKEKYLYAEGSTYKLPETGADYFIETSTGTKYKPGDTVTVDYSMHFEAVKNTSKLPDNVRIFFQKILSSNK